MQRLSGTGVRLLGFSVVIPTYERRNLAQALVRSLAHQEFNGCFDVVVVVDGSKDGSAEALRKMSVPFPLVVLEQPHLGAAVARNRGAAAAQGEILLFLDDDMEAHPRLLAEHDRFHRGGADVVIGHVPLHPNSQYNVLTASEKRWAEERCRRLSSPGASLMLHDLLTGQISLTSTTFHEIGGFDTNFTRGGSYGNEDIDFGYRLLLRGCRIAFNPAAITWHNYFRQPRQSLHQHRQAGHADVAFARRHLDQAVEIFELRKKWIHRWVLRPIAALPLAVPMMAALRLLALTLLDRGILNAATFKLFSLALEMEYWRGVQEAGGMPRPT